MATSIPFGSPTPTQPAVRSAAFLAGLVALAHGVNDAYAAFLAPLLPRIMDKLGLSIAMAATLAMTLSLAASLVQPVMGYLSDRYGRRAFVVLGPLLSAVFLPLMGITSSFWVLVAFLLLGGLGSAVFHPPAASLAARISEGKGSGLRMSIFSLGGSLGWAIGPLIAVGLAGWIGLERLWVAMFPGILVAAVLYPLLPPGRTDRSARPPPAPRAVLGALRGPLGLLFGISVVGAFAQRVFLTMGPIIAARAGASEAVGALALSVYLGAQAVGTLAGGYLADRMDRGRLLAWLTLLAFPAHLLAVSLTPGEAPALVMATVAGFFGMAMMPAVVVRGAGAASGKRLRGVRHRHGAGLGGRVAGGPGYRGAGGLDRAEGSGYGLHAGPPLRNRARPSAEPPGGESDLREGLCR